MDLHKLYQIYQNHRQICTDTRKLAKGDLFFALKGPRFNGNAFVEKALLQGAAFAIVDEAVETTHPERVIRVADVLKTLQELARYHRERFNIPVLGITGSNGKTTTKELVSRVLGCRYAVHVTAGNLNNHIGVPLTLLAMPEATEIAVIELGDNQKGDLAQLCNICLPTHGLITNVGKDHIEGYGSFEGNVAAKAELLTYLQQTGGTAFLPAYDPILSGFAGNFAQPVLFGKPGTPGFAQLQSANPFVHYQTEEGKTVRTQLAGRYNMDNISAARCIGTFFEIDAPKMDTAIATYAPSNNRSQVLPTEQNTLLLDAYNANPSSVGLALESFAAMETELEKCVILGDMLELGGISEAEHAAVVGQCSESSFDLVVFIGKAYHAQKAHWPTEASYGHFFETKDAARAWLADNPPTGMYCLLKGSRGLQLETLVHLL